MKDQDGKEGLAVIVLALGLVFLSLYHMWDEAFTAVRTFGAFTAYGLATVVTLLAAAVATLVLVD